MNAVDTLTIYVILSNNKVACNGQTIMRIGQAARGEKVRDILL